MDKAMLRRAVAYFQSSVDIDKSAAGISKGEMDEQLESTSSGLAASYLTKVRVSLLYENCVLHSELNVPGMAIAPPHAPTLGCSA
jgi:hypothetical protein